MKKESCEVIRDLLPLYEDGVASEKAQKMVQEHLKDCPDCREELRKMHAPLSLPPEQNEELWKTYAQRREKIRRKRQKIIAAVGAVLAAMILVCLWYTRPQKWTDIMGTHQVDNMSVSYTYLELNPEAEDPKEQRQHKHVSLRIEGPEDAAAKAIFDILGRYTYRASPSSLIPRNTISTPGSVLIGVVWDDQSGCLFDVCNNGKLFVPSDIGWDVYYFDLALYDELVAVVQAYGVVQE